MVPAYTLAPDAENVKVMRALVKQTLSRELVDTLIGDIGEACETLERRGGVHQAERQKVKTGVGY